ncbi:tRNA (Adenine(37)-N6)-methyltransferase-like [Melia azedarach]|uniref:tRNA (Adenine(37)-N6)-methyltransferase-like n=2 Tax=Melia azedarach TaxID=155640 RepID=A0ACC1XDT9_MELAZ|nr:tRNA (Adenine(37)-N6)-methyltransferase-like [Melia azedarach]KAJ4709406.1 tRNA (Adenine(37)-N6)-methyltransferase-like [Melia azedarach]
MSYNGYSKSLTLVAVAAISASTVISIYIWKKVKGLERSLNSALQKCSAERQGRIRAQQALRKALAQSKSENLEMASYPMTPIGIVQSCFSTRNGTPRQPLLVPLARACLVFDASRVPPASLEGLGEYSHCWIIYVFHLNTNLEKLWKEPSKSKFKAKVRVPRLKGEKMGVFATRSPHRPCPIGLTVAKVEAVQENMVLLSGVDLVDGTPVLDIKPYLPYCDSIQGAAVPEWVMVDSKLAIASVSFSGGFFSTLADCWGTVEKKSLYASADELQTLIKQVLSWDIRSVSQRNRPHDSFVKTGDGNASDNTSDLDENHDGETSGCKSDQGPIPSEHIIYHLILERLDVSYRINSNGNVIVEKVTISSDLPNGKQNRCNYLMWRDQII